MLFDALFQQVDHEKMHKNTAYAGPIATIGHNTCLMVVSSGFYQSPGSPPLGNVHSIIPAHCCGRQNGQQSWSIFLLSFCLLLPWWPLGQYGVSSCPMVASIGFWGGLGHVASGNAICIAPAYHRGHQNS
jgi:hypothetical protein